MPVQDLRKLLERIHLRLDESFVGIGAQVADLAAADLAELLNELTLVEAATMVSMLPVARAIKFATKSHAALNIDVLINAGYSSTSPDWR